MQDPRKGNFIKAPAPDGRIKKSIAFRRARLESIQEIAVEKGGLSLSGTIDDLLRLGIEAYREEQRASRRAAGIA